MIRALLPMTMPTNTTLTDDDVVQTWQEMVVDRAERTEFLATEVVDFNAMTVTRSIDGWYGPERVRRSSTWEIQAVATPAGAAAYRRQHGMRRVG